MVSALLHLLLASKLSFYSPKESTYSTIEVDFSQYERQIVSPSESEQREPPPETTRTSERDSAAEQESIKRGLPGSQVSASSDAPVPAVQSKPASESRPRTAPSKIVQQSKPNPNLKLDESTLLNQFGQTKNPPPVDPLSASSAGAETPRAFSRPPGSGAKFFGDGGSADYLPSLPDGDLTLLNAKANQYAVFVRRVAVQVFAELRQVGWESLRAPDIRQIGSDAIFEAIMAPNGDLVSVRPIESSGSRSFDEVLRVAVTKGAKDRNPPAGARAEDGFVHFIFKARSWVTISNNARNQAPIERRWLLLATGLL